jgi:hypothetical protein
MLLSGTSCTLTLTLTLTLTPPLRHHANTQLLLNAADTDKSNRPKCRCEDQVHWFLQARCSNQWMCHPRWSQGSAKGLKFTLRISAGTARSVIGLYTCLMLLLFCDLIRGWQILVFSRKPAEARVTNTMSILHLRTRMLRRPTALPRLAQYGS